MDRREINDAKGALDRIGLLLDESQYENALHEVDRLRIYLAHDLIATIRREAAHTIDYDAHVRAQVVGWGQKDGISLAWGLAVGDSRLFDPGEIDAAVKQLVSTGEYVVKHQKLWLTSVWEAVSAERREQRLRDAAVAARYGRSRP